MTATEPRGEPGPPPDPAVEAERRRRQARVFGEVLPEATSDDRVEPGDSEAGSEDWLRRQVPPHHG